MTIVRQKSSRKSLFIGFVTLGFVCSTSYLGLDARKVSANPAVGVVAPAICSTGVGCIFLGAVVVTGVTYYAWKNRANGKRILADISGNIKTPRLPSRRGKFPPRSSSYGRQGGGNVRSTPLNAKNRKQAELECVRVTGTSKPKVFKRGNVWYCGS